MNSVLEKIQRSPVLIRAVPFIVFVLFTACQGKFFENSQYWFYLAKIPLGIGLIWLMRPFVPEMRWAWSWEAVVAGVGVFAMWVGIDSFYPKFGRAEITWKPFETFASNPSLAWGIVIGRILCSTLIVPPLEEVFYRSFMYRYIIGQDLEKIPLHTFKIGAFLIAAVVFGVVHNEWLAGILCAFAYHSLIFRKKRLGDAMTAHAITNLLLGLWVVWKGAWNFW